MQDTNRPTEAPEQCPGTNSENAGKSQACAGCPNQQICSTTKPQGPDPSIPLIEEKFKNIRNTILVLSGKGGVGKSTVSSQLARALAQDDSCQVGLLDIDICGPSIPTMMGIQEETVFHSSGDGWTPIYVQDNLSVMSVGCLLEDKDSAVIWRGPKKNGMIKQFLKDVDWGELDWLIVDTPPGTSDEHLSIVQLLKNPSLRGAIVVTGPQEMAIQDVKKEIDFCRKVQVPVLGIVENMKGFICPKCNKSSEIFPGNNASKLGFPLLASIPLNVGIAKACDLGEEQVFPCFVKLAQDISDIVNKLS